ncbi:hypothetical protein SDRG_02273 [Saprolegnia diclina VS20]|uniref:Peptidase S1 domain-containing protein n=1 Tax=Saprolegnia diclina (strain VS20) TaxID=1156394 RepID=T0QQG2_SAPDV|nr:hypothetical protein SDRG_02273 [Saprolegnia diclina VS20]EQC40374.1 hypothetical protein SDRG_02273 [Saprolegnia diclina VS20]|eukprot:XP_008606073.1 hypothetical protein SDRG_02273 [Saprolegnia diclina VS20]
MLHKLYISTLLLAALDVAAHTGCTSSENATDATPTPPRGHGQPEIIGGSTVPRGDDLFMAGVRKSSWGLSICGAALIAPTYVLTAGHCVDDSINYVAVGTRYNIGGLDGERIRIKRKIMHPEYVELFDTPFNDWAILELETPSTIKPIRVSFDDSPVGTVGTVRGWGRIMNGVLGPPSLVLKQVDVKIWDNDKCNAAIQAASKGTYPHIRSSNVCAGGVQGEDVCQGDSGGPLTITQNGEDVVVGVVSWGYECGLANTPGVYARLSAAKAFISPFLV